MRSIRRRPNAQTYYDCKKRFDAYDSHKKNREGLPVKDEALSVKMDQNLTYPEEECVYFQKEADYETMPSWTNGEKCIGVGGIIKCDVYINSSDES